MLIKKIDGVDSEALETAVAGATNVGGRTIDGANSVTVKAEAELRGDDCFFAGKFTEKPAEQVFVLVRAIDFGGVQKIPAQFEIAVQDSQ